MQRYLDHPVIRYVIISVTSILAAVIFFRLGGSLAEISNSDSPLLGISFRAGGALAGALIFFLLSYRFIEKPAVSTSRVKLHVTRNPKNFSDSDGNVYTCTGLIFNPETNEQRRVPLITIWEAGLLTLNFVGVSPDEWIGAEIQNQANEIWRVHYFDPKTNIRVVGGV
jgi:hypothetical protein